MSTGPSASVTPASRRSTSASRLTSPAKAAARPPAFRTAEAAASARGPSRSHTPTAAPSRPNTVAMTGPMRPPPPVSQTTLPANSMSPPPFLIGRWHRSRSGRRSPPRGRPPKLGHPVWGGPRRTRPFDSIHGLPGSPRAGDGLSIRGVVGGAPGGRGPQADDLFKRGEQDLRALGPGDAVLAVDDEVGHPLDPELPKLRFGLTHVGGPRLACEEPVGPLPIQPAGRRDIEEGLPVSNVLALDEIASKQLLHHVVLRAFTPGQPDQTVRVEGVGGPADAIKGEAKAFRRPHLGQPRVQRLRPCRISKLGLAVHLPVDPLARHLRVELKWVPLHHGLDAGPERPERLLQTPLADETPGADHVRDHVNAQAHRVPFPPTPVACGGRLKGTASATERQRRRPNSFKNSASRSYHATYSAGRKWAFAGLGLGTTNSPVRPRCRGCAPSVHPPSAAPRAYRANGR